MSKQQGSVLILVLIFVSLISCLTTWTIQTALLEQKLATTQTNQAKLLIIMQNRLQHINIIDLEKKCLLPWPASSQAINQSKYWQGRPACSHQSEVGTIRLRLYQLAELNCVKVLNAQSEEISNHVRVWRVIVRGDSEVGGQQVLMKMIVTPMAENKHCKMQQEIVRLTSAIVRSRGQTAG